MNIPTFPEILKKSWALILVTVMVSTATAILITFLITPTYQSRLQILILPTDEKITSANLLNPKQPFTQNQTQVLISNKIVEQMIDDLKLDVPSKKPKGFLKKSRAVFKTVLGYTFVVLKHGRIRKVPRREAIFDKLKSSINAKVLEDSGVIELKVSWSEPKTAKALTDYLAELFVNESRIASREESEKTEKMIIKKIDEASFELNQSNRELIKFRTDKHISQSEFNPSEKLSPDEQATYIEIRENVAATQGNFLFWQNYKQENRARSIVSEEQYQILGEASQSTYPAKPFVALYAIIGSIAGMLAGLGLALVSNVKNETTHESNDIEIEIEEPSLELT